MKSPVRALTPSEIFKSGSPSVRIGWRGLLALLELLVGLEGEQRGK